MLGNFFNNMYYGKNRSDYTPDQLPKNRFQLFFEMLRIRFFKLIQLNFIFLLFALVYVVWIVYNYMVLGQIGEELNFEYLYSVVYIFLLGNIPCQMIFGVGMTGLTYVTRNYARDQHAWVWSDFIDAVKTNWKQGLLMGLIKGIFMFVFFIVISLYFQLYQVEGNLMYYALGWLMVAISLVAAMADMYIWPMIISYELKLRHIIRNSIVLALARLPWSVLFLIIMMVPMALVVLVHPLISLYYVVLGFSLTQFINVSYINSVFDRFINTRIEGAPINQGLRKPEDEEEYEDGEKGKQGT